MYIFLLALLLLPVSAHAYLDPGTGTVLLNLIIAGVAALIYSLKGFFLKLVGKGDQLQKKENHNYKIAILSEGKQYWSTFKSVAEALIAQKVPFKYYTLDVEDPALQIENEFMKSRFLGYGGWAYNKAGRIEEDVLLCTTPNIGTKGYPIKRPEKVKKLIHVLHSVQIVYKKGGLDFYDSVILVNEMQRKAILGNTEQSELQKKNLEILGLPYFDYLKEIKEGKPSVNTNTVLIASSWGSKGLLNSFGTEFIKNIVNAGSKVIVRPHPQSRISEPELIKLYKKQLADFDVVWDETIDPSASMNEAAILITDTSSIKYDFAFVYEKPVITLNIPLDSIKDFDTSNLRAEWITEVERNIGCIVEKGEEKDIAAKISDTVKSCNPEYLREYRKHIVANYGDAGKAVAEHLAKCAGISGGGVK